MKNAPKFTANDAQELIAHAQSAPLVNMKHAEHVSGLLRRFAEWYEHSITPSRRKTPARQSEGGAP